MNRYYAHLDTPKRIARLGLRPKLHGMQPLCHRLALTVKICQSHLPVIWSGADYGQKAEVRAISLFNHRL